LAWANALADTHQPAPARGDPGAGSHRQHEPAGFPRLVVAGPARWWSGRPAGREHGRTSPPSWSVVTWWDGWC